jgi:hypothetical protein
MSGRQAVGGRLSAWHCGRRPRTAILRSRSEWRSSAAGSGRVAIERDSPSSSSAGSSECRNPRSRGSRPGRSRECDSGRSPGSSPSSKLGPTTCSRPDRHPAVGAAVGAGPRCGTTPRVRDDPEDLQPAYDADGHAAGREEPPPRNLVMTGRGGRAGEIGRGAGRRGVGAPGRPGLRGSGAPPAPHGGPTAATYPARRCPERTASS